MKVRQSIGIGLVLLTVPISAFCGEVAVLRNGFTIRCERKQQTGNTTRLYTRAGFLDIPTAEIASFEPDDTPDADPASSPAAMQPAVPPTTNAVAPASTASVAPALAPTAAVLPSPKVTAATSHASLDQVVREASNRHQLDPDFVNSVIRAESNFQARAVSRKGAQGLMQLMPGTASQLGVADPFDPQANVEGGTAYLSQLLDQYHDDPIKALAAYNAGPNRVDQYHGVPPYMETRAYVARIVREYNAKKRAQRNAQSSVARNAKNLKRKAPPSARPQEAGVTKSKKPA